MPFCSHRCLALGPGNSVADLEETLLGKVTCYISSGRPRKSTLTPSRQVLTAKIETKAAGNATLETKLTALRADCGALMRRA